MPKALTLKESYDKCSKEGNIILQDRVDVDRIKSMVRIADDDLESARFLLKEKQPKYGSIYKLYYAAIHQLTEAFILFDRVKSYNHQCLFSYLCTKHPELDLDWEFFEKIRTKRNGIEYYGSQIVEKDWKEVRLQSDVYINTLSKAINDRLKSV